MKSNLEINSIVTKKTFTNQILIQNKFENQTYSLLI